MNNLANFGKRYTRTTDGEVDSPEKTIPTLSDKTSSKWTFISDTKPNKHGHAQALYKCECGIVKEIAITRIKNNRTKECRRCALKRIKLQKWALKI